MSPTKKPKVPFAMTRKLAEWLREGVNIHHIHPKDIRPLREWLQDKGMDVSMFSAILELERFVFPDFLPTTAPKVDLPPFEEDDQVEDRRENPRRLT